MKGETLEEVKSAVEKAFAPDITFRFLGGKYLPNTLADTKVLRRYYEWTNKYNKGKFSFTTEMLDKFCREHDLCVATIGDYPED